MEGIAGVTGLRFLRTFGLWAAVCCLISGLFLLTLLVLGWQAENKVFPRWSGFAAFRTEIERAAAVRPDGAVELAELSGHPVIRACWLSEFRHVLSAAEPAGLPLAGVPDVAVGENHFGLLLIDDGRVSYGELSRRDVDEDALHATGGCVEGSRLALVFDAVDPLAGARIVDLDAR